MILTEAVEDYPGQLFTAACRRQKGESAVAKLYIDDGVLRSVGTFKAHACDFVEGIGGNDAYAVTAVADCRKGDLRPCKEAVAEHAVTLEIRKYIRHFVESKANACVGVGRTYSHTCAFVSGGNGVFYLAEFGVRNVFRELHRHIDKAAFFVNTHRKVGDAVDYRTLIRSRRVLFEFAQKKLAHDMYPFSFSAEIIFSTFCSVVAPRQSTVTSAYFS